MLSIIIVNDPYLSASHLDFQVAALNQQSRPDFEIIYLNQAQQRRDLESALTQAQFNYQVIDIPYPYIGGVCCWDLVRVMAIILEDNIQGDYFTYLHKECIPDLKFVEQTLASIQSYESETGQKNTIYMLNQLRSSLTVETLKPETCFEQLESAEAISWIEHLPIPRDYTYRQQAWEEDAFVMPTALAHQLKLFSAVKVPLFFQDLFDIFLQLENQPYTQHIHWVRLGLPVIYHLNHGREFREYRQSFLQAVRQHPELFGHLALFELAASDFDYQEPFIKAERHIQTQLHRFVHYMRYSERGTVTLWRQSIERAQQK